MPGRMVHTRHSRDTEIDSPSRFLSLEDKRSRKSGTHVSDVDEHDSDQSGSIYQGKDHSIFDEKVVESRLRPRTGPRRAYNYVYADSSDDDVMSNRQRTRIITESSYKMSRRGRRQHERRHAEQEQSSDDEEEKVQWYSTRSRDLHQNCRRQQNDQRVIEEEDEHDREDEEEEDLNNSALRRSSRLRQKPYRFRSSCQGTSQEVIDVNLDRGKRRRTSELNNCNEDFEDMYSRVKRARTKKGGSERQEQSASNSDGTNDDEKNDSEEGTNQKCSYSLREHKPRTQLYIAPAIEAIKKKPKQQSLFRETPPRRIHKQTSYRSPAHRRTSFRKRQAFHGNSSSTSSDSSDSGAEISDEQRFSRRKAKSMAKARSRICPLNFNADMMSSGVLKDRVRTGASLADVDPMEIDKSVTFDSVGGLQKHIMTLKEMVVFPLLYPEFYERFKVAPSRGVLFYGPPGTGKTLVARALANECSRGTQKVAFFMRKGADCLSKWVGEAERQLRLLFDKAYEMRPSIIFFDEIDGLAPVRSSRQDQIHSSIVSTLLALMDGIDSRGEIVVIGATNRIDAIDPALRRPGRFDREFHFPLPNLEDRKKILKIHTKNWVPALCDEFLFELAEKTAGYCGADIKCLVTDATQNALRRHYPQIYTTSDKLQLDISSITLTARDFAQAVSTIVPAAQRAVPNAAMALEASVRPLLSRSLIKLQTSLAGRFPHSKLDRMTNSEVSWQGNNNEEASLQAMSKLDLASDDEENIPSIFLSGSRGSKCNNLQSQRPASFLRFASSASSFPVVFRPRMLVSGAAGQGQSVHLAPAALHLMEHLPVHTLSSATLFAASAKMPEEACNHVFHEAKRTAPSVIYIPYINELWGVVSDSLRVTFLTLIRSMNPSTPILMLATSEAYYRDLDEQLKTLFSLPCGEVVEVDEPTGEERHEYFADLILHQTTRPPPTRKQAELSSTTQGSLHFFPKASNQKNRDSVSDGHSVHTRASGVPELWHNKVMNYTLRPRSKHTKVSEGCKSILVNDVQGSGGECSFSSNAGCLCSSAHNCISKILQHQPSASVTDKLCCHSCLTTPIRDPVKVNKSFTCNAVTEISNKAQHIAFNMVPQSKTAYRKRSSEKSSSTAIKKKNIASRQRKMGNYTVLKRKSMKDLNYNQSASSSVVVNQPVLPVLGKRYPSLRSPYNRKISSDKVVKIPERWFQHLTASHWLRSEARRVLEPLPRAPPPEPHKLTDKEQKKLIEQEDDTLRELRIFLRDILSKLGREKKFCIFTKPVDIEEVSDYYDIIKKPMDLSTMMTKIDLHQYNTASAFLDDIFLICSNALEYNPDLGPTDRAIRHRACSLRDMAQALLKAELDPDFERLCQEIAQSRKRRGLDSARNVPAFYHTRPLESVAATSSCHFLPSEHTTTQSHTVPEGCRYSRRVRGLEADHTLSLEVLEKTVQVEKILLKEDKEIPDKETSVIVEESTAGHAHNNAIYSNKNNSADCTLDTSREEEGHSYTVSDRSECKCSGSSTKVLGPNLSGKVSKGSSENKYVSSSAAKKASMLKKCPWLATKRRRRCLSYGSHRPDKNSHSDVDEVSGDESMDITSLNEDQHVWNGTPRKQREHSPVSAANPANVNVNVSGNTRIHSTTDIIPASHSEQQDLISSETNKQLDFSNRSNNEDICKTHKSCASHILDVDLIVTTDSGLGSESNGDSRDSIDNNNSNSAMKEILDKNNSGNTGNKVVGENRESGEDEAATSSSAGPSFAHTRSHTQNSLQLKALAALEMETRNVQVDKERLEGLLNTVVSRTKGFTVEKLQHLYSVLSCTVYKYRNDFDKTHLVQEMEDTVESFCQGCH